jgi:predicted RNA methylase
MRTRAEAAPPSFAELQRELPRSSPRAWRFAALHAGSRAGALVSEGLRVGHRHGFDSGPFMDHVYADRPAGRTAAGRALDRRLLRRRTCVAFRDIRALAEPAVRDALAASDATEPVVADLAAGPAPYLLAAVADHPRARAVVCDVDEAALDGARAAAQRTGVAGRATFVRANAFDPAALATLRPRPDVVLELGLYGIEHDDARVERHFTDLAELVAPEQIVFNVQTANPEIEYIARVWVNAAGERCVWRLRPVEQILGYAAAAGYRPASTTADRFGIYRVVRLVRDPGTAPPSTASQGASSQRGEARWA